MEAAAVAHVEAAAVAHVEGAAVAHVEGAAVAHVEAAAVDHVEGAAVAHMEGAESNECDVIVLLAAVACWPLLTLTAQGAGLLGKANCSKKNCGKILSNL